MAVGSGEGTAAPGQRRDYLKLFMALCCLSAVGLAGSTYDSTIESDPDEILDVKHEWLPIGKDSIQEFKNPDRSNSAGGGGGGGDDQEADPCTGGMIGFFAKLLPSLIPPCGTFYLIGLLLPWLVLLVLLALIYRYRRRLIAPPLAVWAWIGDVSIRSNEVEAGTWPTEAPANEIHRAWLAMVDRAEIDRPWTRSPGECARAAVDAGLEAEAVSTVTTLFEDVRYGGAQVTDERRARATEWHNKLTDGRGTLLTDGRGTRLTDGGGESW